jgi:hypothetical protein
MTQRPKDPKTQRIRPKDSEDDYFESLSLPVLASSREKKGRAVLKITLLHSVRNRDRRKMKVVLY